MRSCEDPALMSPAERRDELVSILATGLLRLQVQRHLGLVPKPADSVPPGLEVSDETVLSVHTG